MTDDERPHKFHTVCCLCRYVASGRRVATVQDALVDHIDLAHADAGIVPRFEVTVANEPKGKPA